ncbi:DUF6088 family protein [Arachidicoccus soli]|uniref:Type IV toxin-antitoxin system AbiEi family antitoxin domain-containing protein n=1 Tax=Arachidicoccus soli TaxID=2341117 RepID=A0A386HL16_9BACT|nr:DUF6088 family protein [Arachidicoccus soli]AYD46465.1 hypothetical protein D6B99_01840 [Arachidicoccus soli]
MENSISNTIERRIDTQKQGSIIVQTDFRGEGSATAINMTLSRLAEKGKIRRLAHGIYYKPKNDPLFGELLPSPEDVAETIAQKERIRIRPSGMYALNKLGISTQVPTKLVYITNGQRRKISIGNTEVSFRPTTAKKMALKGSLSSLVIQALEELGTENISEDVKAKLKDCLLKEKPALLKNDLALAPARIHDFILKLLK